MTKLQERVLQFGKNPIQQDRQFTYKRNIDARSCNHCCGGNAMSITYCECACSLSYPTCKAHTPYCHWWPDPLYIIFPHYLSKGTIFGKTLLNTKCVFRFHLECLYETFFILRRTERGMIKKSSGLHVKYPLYLSDLNLTWIFSSFFLNTQISNIMKIPPVGTKLFLADRWTDGQTWRSQ